MGAKAWESNTECIDNKRLLPPKIQRKSKESESIDMDPLYSPHSRSINNSDSQSISFVANKSDDNDASITSNNNFETNYKKLPGKPSQKRKSNKNQRKSMSINSYTFNNN